MADNRYKQVQAFNAPTAYDQQMVEARRRRRMAEALANQAYTPQDVGVAPIPAAAPLVQGLQAFLSARAARKADEAEEKAGAAATRTGAELARLLTGGRLPETEAALTEVTPAGRIGPAKVEDLTEVAPAGRIGTAPTQDDIMRLAMTSSGVAAMKGNPLLAARLARTMETPDAEEYYAPVETTEGLVQFGKRGGKRATGMQAPERQKAEAMSGLGRLIAERNALPEGDPRRAVYDRAIDKETRLPQGPSIRVDTGLTRGQTFSNENTLRDEYTTQTAPFRTISDAYKKIMSTADNGAGDMSLLYQYVKLLDPNSVVRESEFATAAASGSFGERVQGEVNRILSGERMAPSLRQSFRNEATNIYNNQRNSAEQTAERYRGLAESYSLDPARVVVETPDERYERWKRSQGKK
jgi:hypothetical protein